MRVNWLLRLMLNASLVMSTGAAAQVACAFDAGVIGVTVDEDCSGSCSELVLPLPVSAQVGDEAYVAVYIDVSGATLAPEVAGWTQLATHDVQLYNHRTYLFSRLIENRRPLRFSVLDGGGYGSSATLVVMRGYERRVVRQTQTSAVSSEIYTNGVQVLANDLLLDFLTTDRNLNPRSFWSGPEWGCTLDSDGRVAAFAYNPIREEFYGSRLYVDRVNSGPMTSFTVVLNPAPSVPRPDAGTGSLDAGPRSLDAGDGSPDAGLSEVPDSGLPDAGPTEAVNVDAGPLLDSGSSLGTPMKTGGCSIATASFGAMMLFLLSAVRRRSAGSRRPIV